MATGSAGICGAGAGTGAAVAGMETTDFGAPLLRGVKLVGGVGGGGAKCRWGGGVALIGGVGACGTDCRKGGVMALLAGVMPREANETGGGVGIRSGGTAADVTGLAATEIRAPSPPAPNGPLISSATSTCFWTARRDSRAGFNRLRISLSGSITGLWSCSPPELTNTPGATRRNSPKAIFTEPNAS